jgi:hypothetical protein
MLARTDKSEYYTPARYIDAVRAVLGAIDLDPASSAIAQHTVKAGAFFTKETDGLTREWHGRVYLNPPYDAQTITRFTDKLLDELRAGRVTAAIMLTHARTSSQWFQRAHEASAAICLAQRIAFLRPDGTSANAPPVGSVFFYFGQDVERFREVFAEFGIITVPDAHAALSNADNTSTTSKFPKTLAAAKRLAECEKGSWEAHWQLGDALIRECGPPGDNGVNTKSDERLKKAQKALREHGYEYGFRSLEQHRSVSHHFPARTRVRGIVWSVYRAAGDIETLEGAKEYAQNHDAKLTVDLVKRFVDRRTRDALSTALRARDDLLVSMNATCSALTHFTKHIPQLSDSDKAKLQAAIANLISNATDINDLLFPQIWQEAAE